MASNAATPLETISGKGRTSRQEAGITPGTEAIGRRIFPEGFSGRQIAARLVKPEVLETEEDAKENGKDDMENPRLERIIFAFCSPLKILRQSRAACQEPHLPCRNAPGSLIQLGLTSQSFVTSITDLGSAKA
jgi:hypothetical protein